MPPTYDHTVDPNQATFLGFGLEGIAYGINVILFATAIVILLRRPTNRLSATPGILAITCFMFALCTVHYSLNFNNVYNGTMRNVHAIATETHLLAGADMLFVITDFCSQLILIYRCYLVWGKNIWVVIIPIIVALAAVSCGLALLGLVLSIAPSAPQAPAAIVPVGDAAFAMSLILNFFSSALIVGRIWWMSRQTRALHGDQGPSIAHSRTSIRDAIGIIIESGLLFLAAQFVFVVLFAIAHPAQAVVEPIATQIYGTAPMLIIVRVGMGAAYEQTHPMSTTAMTSIRFNSRRAAPHASRTMHTELSHDGGPLELSKYNESSRGTVVVPELHVQ